MHWKRMTAVAAALMIAVAACDSPASRNNQNPGGKTGDASIGAAQVKATDPSAKGPAPEVPGAKHGGMVTVLSDVTPDTFDPTNTYFVDGIQIEKLYLRALTQYRLDGPDLKPVLVPDLAEDLGTVSADKLTWTFKLKRGIKYQDGTPVRAADYAYAIKRSFAHDIYDAGPAYQLQFFKDGDTYKGPYADGQDYAGVETPNDNTLVIHLRKPFPDLPYFVSFPMFTPIPKLKDARRTYDLHPMSTGPYQVASYTPGSELRLTTNPYWDPATDPVRHQYVDGFDIRFGQDTIKAQRQVLASSGLDANALNYSDIDASLLPEVKDQSQIVKGPQPCTNLFTLDTRKIPLDIRRIIAKVYPYDSYRKVAGLTPLNGPTASTILPPAVPGFEQYVLPGLTGTGKGADDPAIADEAKKELDAALRKLGETRFELSWYYKIDDKIDTQISELRKAAFEKAGFTVKVIGVPKAKYRTLVNDQEAPVNIGKTPASWCSDWPSGSSWFPVLFKSDAIALGNSVGQLEDKTLDAEIDRIANMTPDHQLTEWPKLDKQILQQYLPAIPLYYSTSAYPVGKNLGHVVNDMTQGMPEFTSMYLKQP
jgi:peptide/nickel transport system substrate-binding protein